MAALETVTVRHDHDKHARQERISRKVKAAVDAMVFEALSRKEAALKAGLTDHALYCALCKPHVMAYMNTQQRVIRTSAASRTIAKAEKLMDGAVSEHVQADMAKWLAGLEGISPITRSENLHVHQVHIPGLTVIRGNWAPHADDVLLIGDQRADGESAHQINRIGSPVPHPGMPRLSATPNVYDNTHYGKSDAKVLNTQGNPDGDKAQSAEAPTSSTLPAQSGARSRRAGGGQK